jgi:hypothetical protein
LKHAPPFSVDISGNPGGGMPMVLLCDEDVAKKVIAWDK